MGYPSVFETVQYKILGSNPKVIVGIFEYFAGSVMGQTVQGG